MTEVQISGNKEVIVELEINGHTHRRVTQFEGDLNALRAAIFTIYQEMLVLEIVKVSGESPEDIRDPETQEEILEQCLHIGLYKKKFKAFVDLLDAADVKDEDTLRAFVPVS